MKHLMFLVIMLLSPLASHAQQHVAYAYDASGNRISRTIVMAQGSRVQRATGIQDYSDDVGGVRLRIYPNPVVETLTVDIDGDGKASGAYALYDPNGRLVASGKIGNERTAIDMSGLGDGLYVLKATVGEHSTSWKIIKK